MKQYRSPNYSLPSQNGANFASLADFCQHFRAQIDSCFGFKQLPALLEPIFGSGLTFVVVQRNESLISSFRIALSQ